MTHFLKIFSKYFDDVQNGVKTFEVRKNDRGYKVGDILILKEVVENDKYTGRMIKMEITYFFSLFGLATGYCVLGVKKCV